MGKREDDQRMRLLTDARQRACEMVNDSSCLSDEYFAKLQELGRKVAIETLALEFLQEAINDHEDMEDLDDHEDMEDLDDHEDMEDLDEGGS